jgi:hypothetical protein
MLCGLKIGQIGSGESRTKNLPYRRGVLPVGFGQAIGLELTILANHHLSRREQRALTTPEFILAKILNPGDNDLHHLVANWEKEG